MKRLCVFLVLVTVIGVFACALAPSATRAADSVNIVESGAYLYGVPEKVTLAQFRQLYGRNNFEVLKADGSGVAEKDYIATGTKIKYEKDIGTVVTLEVVVTGDIDGNGRVTTTDYITIRSYLKNPSILTGAKLEAADVDGDGIGTSDYFKVKLYFSGLYDIYANIVVPEDSSADDSINDESDPWTPGWS